MGENLSQDDASAPSASSDEAAHPQAGSQLGPGVQPLLAADIDRELQVKVTLPGRPAGDAADRFKQCMQAFAADLARETSRLELDARAPGENDPVITPSMVTKANAAVRDPEGAGQGPRWLAVTAQLGVMPASIGAGAFASYLNSVWQWSGFLGSSALAVACSTIIYFMSAGRKRS